MKNIRKKISKYFFFVFFCFLILFIIASGNKKEEIIVSNINNVKSVQSSRIIHEYEPETIKFVKNTKEISKYGKKYKINFTGTLTGYGPDCKGCIGVLYCAPHPDVTEGKIYYNDKEYGKLRIVAADYSIPCGSIVRISNYKFVEGNELYAIVLDRGSAIVGLTMDLLYPSEKDTEIIGRNYNINFQIERWGW